jgi:ribulose-phosphate 3-epimerase
MKISASIYSNKEKELKPLIAELDAHRVDFFHIDCNDDPSVFDDISKIRKLSSTPIDLHLITPTPEKYFELIEKNKIENVTFQYEQIGKYFEVPEGLAQNVGLSIVSGTSVDVFEAFKQKFSFVLFMATTPGESGGKFNKENFKKINQFRNKFPGKKIVVDGGINEELSFVLRNMGVSVVVIGSYLFRSDFIGSALLQLRSDDIESPYRIIDFMLDMDETPVIKSGKFSFYDVLKSIDEYKLGFTTVVDDKGIMQGIITNADVRKSLLRNYAKLADIDVNDMINRNPAFVYDYETVTEMLAVIKTLDFPVLFMPVVSKEKKLVGTVKFNNLIKGES